MYRKLYHISGLVFPVIMFLWSREAALWTAGVLFVLIMAFDAARLSIASFNKWIFKTIPSMFKPGEFNTVSGSPYFLGGVFLCLLLYEHSAAAGGIIYLSLGDMSAVLVGEKYGRIKVFNKTLEGSAAFIAVTFTALSALAIGGVLDLSIAGIAAGAVICALVELLPLKLDDNLLIPLSGGLVLSLIG